MMEKTEEKCPAELFLLMTQATMSITFDKHGKYFFPADDETRDVYTFALDKDGKHYQSTFGQSIANVGVIPTSLEILGCLETEVPESFEDFCGDFGYEEASRSAEKTYNAVKDQAVALNEMFNVNEIEMLRRLRDC